MRSTSHMSMGIQQACIVVVAGLSLSCLGCGSSSDFDDARVRNTASSKQYTMSGEQVTLTQQQVDCGVENELWLPPSQVSQHRYVARLADKGRALKFSDDVSIGEPGFPQPYTQINGAFDIQVDDILDTRNVEQGVKNVVVRLGVKIPHGCFPNPLPIMGVRKGHFDEGTPPTLQFVLRDDWALEQVVH